MVLKALAAFPDLMPFNVFLVVYIASSCLWSGHSASAAQRISEVVGFPFADASPHKACSIIIVYWSQRLVNGKFGKIGTVEAVELCVDIGEETRLQEWVIGDIDACDDIARMKGNLFCFGKEVVWISVQHHLAHPFQWNQLFRNYFRRIQQVKIKFVFIFFVNQLHTKLIFRIVAHLDSFPEVTPQPIGVLA